MQKKLCKSHFKIEITLSSVAKFMANFSDRPHFLCFIGATNDKFLTNQGAGNTSFIS